MTKAISNKNALEEKKLEVASLEKEIEELEGAWAEANEELTLNFSRAKRQFDEKRDEMELKQQKIDFYEENYSRLIQDLKRELEKREGLINEYKRMPKDMKREYLSEMIFGTKGRYKEYEQTTVSKTEELKKLSSSITKTEEEIKYLSAEITTRLKDGEDKKKPKDVSFDKMKSSFEAVLKTFNSTRGYMDKLVELRVKNRQLQERVQELRRNKYQEIAERLKKDLEDLKA